MVICHHLAFQLGSAISGYRSFADADNEEALVSPHHLAIAHLENHVSPRDLWTWVRDGDAGFFGLLPDGGILKTFAGSQSAGEPVALSCERSLLVFKLRTAAVCCRD
jgi:hypothetical protein